MRLHCTAIGKVLLANSPVKLQYQVAEAGLVRRTPRKITNLGVLRSQLERTRETGVAYEYEQSAAGLVA